MRNLKITSFFLLLNVLSYAQDSAKVINHEIGFNTVSLIKQVLSNNPSTSLTQLPYDVFYNVYFKDRAGIRVGLGISRTTVKTRVDGQSNPRTTTQNALALRTGLSYNFLKKNRLTMNVFADGLTESFELKTVNTNTNQTIGNPIQSFTTTAKTKVAGSGAQVGVGVKFNIVKNLSLYTEVPLGFVNQVSVSETVVVSTATNQNPPSKTTTSSSLVYITVPATVYLVLRF